MSLTVDFIIAEVEAGRAVHIASWQDYNVMIQYLNENEGTSSTSLRQFVQDNEINFAQNQMTNMTSQPYNWGYDGNGYYISNYRITSDNYIFRGVFSIKNITLKKGEIAFTSNAGVLQGRTKDSCFVEDFFFEDNVVTAAYSYTFISNVGNVKNLSTNSVINLYNSIYLLGANGISKSVPASKIACLDEININGTAQVNILSSQGYATYMYARPKITSNYSNFRFTGIPSGSSYRYYSNCYFAPIINAPSSATITPITNTSNVSLCFYDKDIINGYNVTGVTSADVALTTAQLQSETALKALGWEVDRL